MTNKYYPSQIENNKFMYCISFYAKKSEHTT